jgi:hypothetical protein
MRTETKKLSLVLGLDFGLKVKTHNHKSIKRGLETQKPIAFKGDVFRAYNPLDMGLWVSNHKPRP